MGSRNSIGKIVGLYLGRSSLKKYIRILEVEIAKSCRKYQENEETAI